MKYDIKIIKSKRKSFSLEIKPDFTIICRAPIYAGESEINAFINKHTAWLERHVEKLKKSDIKKNKIIPLSDDEITALKKRTKQYIPARVEFFAKQMSVEYGNITIRAQKTRWGSCSSSGNLSFNCLLMLTDISITDYVIVHELCHLKEMNHSKKFWSLVESVMPDYKLRREQLKKCEGILISRLK